MHEGSRSPCDSSSLQILPTAPALSARATPPGAPPWLPRVLNHLERDRLAWALGSAGRRLVPSLARAARAFLACQGWTGFGYARLGDFARERLARSGRWARDLDALGAGLEALPGLEVAMLGTDGARPLGRVAALGIARTASPETLAEWIALGRGVTVRELLEAARQARRAGRNRPLAHDAPEVLPNSDRAEDEEEEAVQEVRLVLPLPVDVAFDETLDLYRAVTGGEASVVSFVEALVGEASAGPYPPDADLQGLRSGIAAELRERALERATHGWDRLRSDDAVQGGGSPRCSDSAPSGTPVSGDLEARIVRALEHVAGLEAQAGEGDPATLAGQIETLVALEDEIERLQGQVLDEMGRRGDWSQLGFDGVGHYSEERLGMRRRTGECRAGIVGAVRQRPRLRDAYESGAIGHEAAGLVARVLGRGAVEADLEQAWVERAEEVTVKRLRDEVRRARLLSVQQMGRHDSGTLLDLDGLPTSMLVPGERRPIGRMCCLPPPPASDAEWHASLRRWPGLARLRVWRLGWSALARTDADVLRCLRLPEDVADVFLAAIESERRRLEHFANDLEWPEPRCEAATAPPAVSGAAPPAAAGASPAAAGSPSLAAAQEFATRARRVPAWVGLLSMLEDFVATWDDPRAMEKREWEPVYERAGYRCMAPGCTGRKRIQDHHVVYRSKNGSDELWNQLAACAMHHLQGEHGELARVRGRAPLGVTWRLGRSDLASWWRNERRLDRARNRPWAAP